jgi:hypothetical protein
MAKLPENFVKPPAASRLTTGKTSAPKTSRRIRKAELEAEAATYVHDVLVRLTPDEHQALAAACDALAAVGEIVTIEDMIKQVIARWIAATRAIHGPIEPAPVEPGPDPIVSQLRRLAEQPVRGWRAIGETLRRWTRVWRAPAR